MALNDFPLVNGVACSWSDVGIKASPKGGKLIDVGDIAGVKRNRTVEVGEQKQGGRVVARTTGEVKYEFSMTLYRSGHSSLLEVLADLAPIRQGNQARVGLVPMFVQVQHTPFGSTRLFDWRAKGVRLAGDAMDAGEGSEADKVEVPCSVIEIVDWIKGKEVLFI
jgi:hypothetical protein